MAPSTPVIARMQSRIREWEAASDDKVLFLNCYMRMTSNMLVAIQEREFNDPAWINRLLDHFADYYFAALHAYERDPASAPAVWQRAYEATCDPEVTALEKLLLGVNAHINYDLVLTLDDLLRPEWRALSERQRAARYADHCRVNEVIGRTINAVQDYVLEPVMPVMDYIDKLLGPFDEVLISHLITRWRETVWRHATSLLTVDDPHEQAQLIRNVEAETLKTAAFICRKAAQRSRSGAA